MKKLYWRPQRISTRVVLALALVAVAGFLSVETFRVKEKQVLYKEKVRAARLCAQAFALIKEERLKRGLPIDTVVDPGRTGLVGQLISPGTTNTGHLPAKLTTINPNWAAVAVHQLGRAGVKEGDVVALGISGSFPALNVAVLTAIKALKARAVTISSAGASQWGANIPAYMWPDMERVLVRRRLLPEPSVAISLGGLDDKGTGLSEEGLAQLRAAIKRSGRPALEVTGFEDSLKRRMALYREHAGEDEIKVYVNVGGGTVSVGTAVGKANFKPGLNRYLPRGAGAIDSVMTRFSKGGVPVIHLSKISKLAERYKLPEEPRSMPAAGQGTIFVRQGYSLWLAGGVLALLVLLMVALLRLDLAYRLRSTSPSVADGGSPEPMV